MGLLVLGTPLDWPESEKFHDYVRENGIKQFLHMYDNFISKKQDILLWGDEIEYIVVSMNDNQKTARVSLRQEQILKALGDYEERFKHIDFSPIYAVLKNTRCSKRADAILSEAAANPSTFTERLVKENPSLASNNEAIPFRAQFVVPTFHPEYGRYMLESTPGAPYGSVLKDFLFVECNMLLRRKIIENQLLPHEHPLTITNFLRLGTNHFTDPETKADGQTSRSFFLPDDIINTHVRFPTLTANIRQRRQRKVAMNVPIFFDKNTPKPFRDPTVPWDRDLYPEDKNAKEGAALEDHIYMDSMGFGMGCCCLQLTFQAKDCDEARLLYDQLTPITPLMLGISAGTPAFRGYLAEQDCRWSVIAGAVDDRTKSEMESVPKSRYDSVDMYISNDPRNLPEYNDVPVVSNEGCYEQLIKGGIDEKLSKHMAHIFARDPLVIFSDNIQQDNSTSNGHFENLNSTNWQSMRFKPPPLNSSIGWRVEFRSMEIQFTEFENAAYSVFVVMLSRAILSFDLNFYMPISLVDENMVNAQARDAIHRKKFWFRCNPFSNAENPLERGQCRQLTLDQIFNGEQTENGFPGLVQIVRSYLYTCNPDAETLCSLDRYLRLVSKRASGKCLTEASWIRNFITTHPLYKQDSVVSPEINYDLIKRITSIINGERNESLFNDCRC
ncbi:glutamate-cysteine ligase Gcs1 [Schizosaccharomyces osmophilus]|uniref:Glutamate--cysteine ligase n=1 Tax=Schizosaccharomyces osmophilus TaxID=2545709 RepID=A0AAF0AV40_9SCHI|nr:glutamate-cysteine ligase Gcs1 [Schizosaccharomyces osmophilus]WBW71539.1 glutamate-cysteine ligase Gcs1 [Schizosaccharomyces osmophilus]